MTVRAFLVPESVSHDPRTTPKLLLLVASRTLDRRVSPFERVTSQFLVLERFDCERRSEVTGIACSRGFSQAELAGVNVAMATRAFPRHAAIGRSPSTESVLLRRGVATIAV